MKNKIKKIAISLIFCFSTYIFSSVVAYADHNDRRNRVSENWGNGGKWIDFTGIVLGTAVLVGVVVGGIYLLRKGPDFSDKKIKKEEAEEEIAELKQELKELKSEITKNKNPDGKKDYKVEKEEDVHSLYKRRLKRDKNKNGWKVEKEDGNYNFKDEKKIKPVDEYDDRENKIKKVISSGTSGGMEDDF